MGLEERIKEQFPVLIVTLLSVLIGLDFTDLVGMMRARITLWPLDVETLRTWGQILAHGSVCVSIWIIFAQLAVSRFRIPTLADTLVVFLAPLMILLGNSLVGLKPGWLWFYFASAYLLIAGSAWQWQIRIAIADHELASFARLLRPVGPLSVIYFGIPFYAAAGWADSHGLVSRQLEMLLTFSGGPAAILTTWIFVREWRAAIASSAAEGA